MKIYLNPPQGSVFILPTPPVQVATLYKTLINNYTKKGRESMANISKYRPFTLKELAERQIFLQTKKLQRYQIGNSVYRKMKRLINNLSEFDLSRLAKAISEKTSNYQVVTRFDITQKLSEANRRLVIETMALWEDEGNTSAMLHLYELEPCRYNLTRLYKRFRTLFYTSF